jgi:hypothetical protein
MNRLVANCPPQAAANRKKGSISMKSSQADNLVLKARTEFAAAQSGAVRATHRANAARKAHRQSKLKLKLARKSSKRSRKLAKQAGRDLAAAQQALQEAGERLRKASKKALKKLKQVRASAGKSQAKSANAAPKKAVQLKSRKHKPAHAQNSTRAALRVKPKPVMPSRPEVPASIVVPPTPPDVALPSA